MVALLREALRMLCGANHWSYAVFWKIGCQNTKLLIWEECYYEPPSCSVPPCVSGNKNPGLPLGGWEGCLGSEIPTSQIGNQSWDRVHILINKMMRISRINLVGQGIVGRAAFIGNHQWILANSFTRDTHPPEVLNEVHLQFSAGMQTVAVIPILPHGVVQLGSSLPIMESMGFINGVKNLIQQLGCIPGALLSNSYGTNECAEKIGIPISLGVPLSLDPSGIYGAANSASLVAESCNQQSNRSEAPRLVGTTSSPVNQNGNIPQANASTSQLPSLLQTLGKPYNCQPKIGLDMKSNLNLRGQLDGVVGAEAIPSNSPLWPYQHALLYNQRSGFNNQPVIGQSSASHAAVKSMERLILSDADVCDNVTHNMDESNSQGRPTSIPGSVLNPQNESDINPSCTVLSRIGLRNVDSSRTEVPLSALVNQVAAGSICPGNSHVDLAPKKERMDNDLFQALNLPLICADDCISLNEHLHVAIHDCPKHESGTLSPGSIDASYEDVCIRTSSGDDLFDVLGADLKKTLLNGKCNGACADGQNLKTHKMGRDSSRLGNTLGAFSANEGMSGRRIYTGISTDHLLDAVVSSSHSASKQISDDDASCRSTSTKISSSSIPSVSTVYGRVNTSSQAQGQLLSLQSLTKAGPLASSSYQSGCSKDDTGTCSQTTSVYGSQISSWVEQSQSSRHDTKKNDEIPKPNRKRLKPGENPRPRPKDRQMIQDRVRELREIVPNGTKCSIDALLEKTIKHMLFLQSVTKHADKLKQAGEPKIINKDGGVILKDDFEGGATWAFEVRSQSMVCPIIVEDLNPPRQMLVEMICEERGFFLEIADLIRGMGLTILKGVMETRNDKIWARFAVEANRDVTRMEIFMSLVHLLDQTGKGSATPASALDGNSIMVPHSFPQGASIPATGRASSLQ